MTNELDGVLGSLTGSRPVTGTETTEPDNDRPTTRSDLTAAIAAIDGVNARAAEAVAAAYGSVDEVAEASLSELQQLKGVGAKTAAAIHTGLGGVSAGQGTASGADPVLTTLRNGRARDDGPEWRTVKLSRSAYRLIDEMTRVANRNGHVTDKQDLLSSIVVAYGQHNAATLADLGVDWTADR